MSRDIIGRSLASAVTCLRCEGISRTNAVFHRSVSNSSPRTAEDSRTPMAKLSSLYRDSNPPRAQDATTSSAESPGGASLDDTIRTLNTYQKRARGLSQGRPSGTPYATYSYDDGRSLHESIIEPPHHLHVYATKHNTHITLTRPSRDPILSVAAGNIGFRKAARGSYDAAYQLAAYVMARIQDRGLMSEIQKLEVVLRGFGAGREAVTKTLLGSEGRNLRGRVVRVTDATRLKFGGTRSPKPRRLG
ncbi:MAG: hypothetical protein M1830_007401 [Pleopsidium flavum]|nr:MAG: hypothetical protein M1830_007556 [Pleopsidium flavum]KAI9876077.1 MAG: hypothetical protein M1830_007401 [Pleopsidium flavum]